jgi:HK97 family phage major capsid protein
LAGKRFGVLSHARKDPHMADKATPTPTDAPADELEQEERLTRRIAELRQFMAEQGQGYNADVRGHLAALITRRDELRQRHNYVHRMVNPAAAGAGSTRDGGVSAAKFLEMADGSTPLEDYPEWQQLSGEERAALAKLTAPADAPVSTRSTVPAATADANATLLHREQRYADWARARYPGEHDTEPLSFAKTLHGLITGEWRDATPERRALGEATGAAGGVMVPTPIAGDLIDRARNMSRCFQAGAVTIPMDAQTIKVPRLAGDPVAAGNWRNEASTISETNMTFDAVTFTAQTLSFYVRASRELIEDSTAGGGVEQVVRNAFAKVIAIELDRAILLGSGTPPEPKGILSQTGVTLTAHGANGSVIGSPPAAGTIGWEFLVDALATVRSSNFEPTGIIDAVRTEQSLSKLRDTTNQYIAPPAYLQGFPRYPTKQVPINITVGTSTDCSYVFTGQWDQAWVGLRTGFGILPLVERFADTGQVAFLAWLRADVQLAQAAAFNVDTGVRG